MEQIFTYCSDEQILELQMLLVDNIKNTFSLILKNKNKNELLQLICRLKIAQQSFQHSKCQLEGFFFRQRHRC